MITQSRIWRIWASVTHPSAAPQQLIDIRHGQLYIWALLCCLGCTSPRREPARPLPLARGNPALHIPPLVNRPQVYRAVSFALYYRTAGLAARWALRVAHKHERQMRRSIVLSKGILCTRGSANMIVSSGRRRSPLLIAACPAPLRLTWHAPAARIAGPALGATLTPSWWVNCSCLTPNQLDPQYALQMHAQQPPAAVAQSHAHHLHLPHRPPCSS